uniref:t-SNARE coiled-coil homology domain-containing protein n=1 Tax=Leptocylindrus danicus TaxID=163516 RepID=A0A7S2PDM4_9STRA|mmetsp:Transcript_3011/g.4344  ORF Transcript_3011/g.4344 Transcript_3011/m.4344 type:complete len:307 (+) Transcript_3011:134-1054(+)|eukprot:CAMPEP_0116013554 /NCGR_PEP_ID=MMETSP0321-20121206/5791_1 /TAXON_ID=163516 /ORGANISM="Leptocylindrus danicus var. danicus, Strain B650" /LENGTH=306 /DNA_ID=CAMNT_0003483117 /DNA_START=80 /DNA_END=1000 /DNA_ORIENTATION=+
MASYAKLGTEKTTSSSSHNDLSRVVSRDEDHVQDAARPKLAPLLGDEGQPYSDDIEQGTTSMDDPFHVFKEDLLRKVEDADNSLHRYLRLVFDTDTAVNTHEVRDAKKQCKRHFKSAESSLKDLQKTVRLVENSRGLPQFQHINDDELLSRQSFIQTTGEKVSAFKDRMASHEVKNKIAKDERMLVSRRSGNLGARNKREQENTDFIVDQQATAQTMMRQQDEVLDDLDEAVIRVGNMAGSIEVEIAEQNKMLNSLDEDLTDAEEKLGFVMGKLAKLLKTKNKCQLGLILVLMLVVIILFFMVIYL